MLSSLWCDIVCETDDKNVAAKNVVIRSSRGAGGGEGGSRSSMRRKNGYKSTTLFGLTIFMALFLDKTAASWW